MRALEPDELRWWIGALGFWASIGAGMLIKGLIAALFPVGGALFYLLFTGLWRDRETRRRLSGRARRCCDACGCGAVAYAGDAAQSAVFRFHPAQRAGEYRGFLWFYFINEQVLRFLNLRYPRDYNTVPRLYFWLFHLLWLFPWSVYFPAVLKRAFRPTDRAARTRLLAFAGAGFILVFFTFSTTQEYYSMPCYPALALLLGGGDGGEWASRSHDGSRACWRVDCRGLRAAAIAGARVIAVRGTIPRPAIFRRLWPAAGDYTLALDHMEDLTIPSFAYLRLPLVIAGLAFLIGAIGIFGRGRCRRRCRQR